jgi:methylenetetrahydrofolate reductase (NADPH)
LTTLKHIAFIPKTFAIDLPQPLAGELVKCKTDTQVKQLGIEWCIQQSKELMAKGAPCVHFYTMGKGDAVRAICEQIR